MNCLNVLLFLNYCEYYQYVSFFLYFSLFFFSVMSYLCNTSLCNDRLIHDLHIFLFTEYAGGGNIDSHTNTTQNSTYEPPQNNTLLNPTFHGNYGNSVNDAPSLTGCNSFGERVIYLRSNLQTLKEKVEVKIFLIF